MKLLSTTFKALLSSTLLALALGLQSIVEAADAKEYPGSACLPDSRNTSSLDYIRFRNGFEARDTIIVECPIVRDNATNTNGINYAFIRIHREPGNPSPFCSFIHKDHFGKRLRSQDYSSFPVGDSYRKYKINSSFNRGSYVFRCALRNGDVLYSYKVSEY